MPDQRPVKKEVRPPAGSGRDVLLDAASALMTESGTSDVSLHAIARRADVSAPLITYHFGSKEGLLVALVERDTARSLDQLHELGALRIPASEKLRLHITGIIRTYARHPYLNGLLHRLIRDPNFGDAQRIKDSFVQPLIEAQRRIIEEGIAAGEFRQVDPDHAYFVIVGACQYLFATRVPFRDMMNGAIAEDAFARAFAASAVDMILNGVART